MPDDKPTARFPRPRDDEPFAWGLKGCEPLEPWERFSPAYETTLERMMRVLHDMGFDAHIGGAGSQDGEYIMAKFMPDPSIAFFVHLEDPSDARLIHKLGDIELRDWIWQNRAGGWK